MRPSNEQWLLAWLLSIVAVLMLSSPARAATGAGSIIEVVTSPEGKVVFAAEDVPGDVELDAASVQVTIDGTAVDATVATAAADGPAVPDALPRRTAVLAVDTSGSMAGAPIQAARGAAMAFLEAAPDDVLVGLVSFDDAARVVVPPTRDRGQLRAAVGDLEARGATTLYDGIALAAGQLGREGERSLIVLSDGADTRSGSTAHDVVETLRRAAATVEIVAFRVDRAQEETLTGIAQETGARVHAAGDGGKLADTFAAAALAFDQQVAVAVPALAGLDAGEHSVAVSMRFGDLEVSGDTTVTIAGSAFFVPTTLQLVLVLLVVFLGLLGLAAALLLPTGPRKTSRFDQLARYTLNGAHGQLAGEPDSRQAAVAVNLLALSKRYVQRRGMTERIALRLDRADIRLRPHEWLVVRSSVIVTSAAALGVLTGHIVVGGLLGGVAGWALTAAYLGFRAGRRLRTFADLLPDGLQLVASSLQTGFSLPQALDSAARDGRAPLSTEFSRAINEARLGSPLEDALDRVADRMDSKDLRWAVMAVRIQREVGGNLAEVLRTTVATIRERAALQRQVRALSAEGRLSMYILMALPLCMLLWLLVSNREYVSQLWTEPLGLLMSVAGVVSMTLGYFWMRGVVKVEV